MVEIKFKMGTASYKIQHACTFRQDPCVRDLMFPQRCVKYSSPLGCVLYIHSLYMVDILGCWTPKIKALRPSKRRKLLVQKHKITSYKTWIPINLTWPAYLLHKNIFASILLKYISKEQSTGSYATFENLPVNKMFAVTFTVPPPPSLPEKKEQEIYVTQQSM